MKTGKRFNYTGDENKTKIDEASAVWWLKYGATFFCLLIRLRAWRFSAIHRLMILLCTNFRRLSSVLQIAK